LGKLTGFTPATPCRLLLSLGRLLPRALPSEARRAPARAPAPALEPKADGASSTLVDSRPASSSLSPLSLSRLPLSAVRVQVCVDGVPVHLPDVTCSLRSLSASVQLLAAEGSAPASAQGLAATDVQLTPTLMSTPTYAIRTAVLQVSCTRASGQSATPLSWTVSPLPIRMAVCAPLPGSVASQQPLADLAVAVAVNCSDPCAPACGTPLPASIGQYASCAMAFAPTAGNDSMLAQNALALYDAASGRATFHNVVLNARQGSSWRTAIACTLGPAPLLVADDAMHAANGSLTLQGCPAGQQPAGVFCVQCAATEFSAGTRCVPCPVVGASCVDGILPPVPNYYRPLAHAGRPIDSTLQL